VDDLITEAARMPDAAVRFAQGTGTVGTPDNLVPLRDNVRTKHKAELERLFATLDRRFNQPNASWMGAFRAGAELALMEKVARRQLEPRDRRLLRQLWEALLAAS
jgi:cation diffusion facilitator CzcD-associated flavoprotein CzcO